MSGPLRGLGGAVRIDRIGSEHCTLCLAARACAPAIALGSAELIENARAHLLVALVIGLRRDPIELCDGCKGKLEAFAHHITRGAS